MAGTPVPVRFVEPWLRLPPTLAAFLPITWYWADAELRAELQLRRAFCQRVVDLRLAADDLAQLGPGVAPAPPGHVPDARPVPWLLPGLLLLGLLVVLVWQRLRHPRALS